MLHTPWLCCLLFVAFCLLRCFIVVFVLFLCCSILYFFKSEEKKIFFSKFLKFLHYFLLAFNCGLVTALDLLALVNLLSVVFSVSCFFFLPKFHVFIPPRCRVCFSRNNEHEVSFHSLYMQISALLFLDFFKLEFSLFSVSL